MYRIFDGRGTGKTSRLLLLAKESGATVVCANPMDMRHKAYAYGLTGIDFMSYQEFLEYENVSKGREPRHYLIDEAEMLLQKITHEHLDGYTISTGD